MPLALTNVCFEGKNGHDADVTRCLFLTQSGLCSRPLGGTAWAHRRSSCLSTPTPWQASAKAQRWLSLPRKPAAPGNYREMPAFAYGSSSASGLCSGLPLLPKLRTSETCRWERLGVPGANLLIRLLFNLSLLSRRIWRIDAGHGSRSFHKIGDRWIAIHLDDPPSFKFRKAYPLALPSGVPDFSYGWEWPFTTHQRRMQLWVLPAEAEILMPELAHLKPKLFEEPGRHQRAVAPRLVRWWRFPTE
jgi:hypothetical protein